MKRLEQLIKKPLIFQRTLGLSIAQFEILAASLEFLWAATEIQRKSKRSRIRNIGAGHPYHLSSIKEKLTAILLYYKALLHE